MQLMTMQEFDEFVAGAYSVSKNLCKHDTVHITV